MSLLTETKSNALGLLTAWRYVPAHLGNLGKLSRKLIKLLLRAMATILAIVACLAAPFLFLDCAVLRSHAAPGTAQG